MPDGAVSTRRFKGADTYEIQRGGVLRIEVARSPEQGLHYFAPGQWVEVAEYVDPIRPTLRPD